MRISISGEEYYLDFEHNQNPTFKDYWGKMTPVMPSDVLKYYETYSHRGETRAILYQFDHTSQRNSDFHEGYALCKWEDRFDKKHGRKLALRRLLEHSSFTKEERRNIWEQYFVETKETNLVLSK